MLGKKGKIENQNGIIIAMVGRKLALALLACLLVLPLLGWNSGGFNADDFAAKPTRTPKKGSGSGVSASAYDVIAAVNQVRAANGLAPFAINGALMAAAQAHSDYQAATGSVSHTGSGGSSPGSRASAAGYSGSVIENIYSGMNASPQQAVSWWQGDSLHLNTLLSTRHSEAGAGVASSNGVMYYTLDVGTGTGGSSGTTGAAVPAATGAPGVAPATVVAFNPVKIATPGPDGSIVHVVEAGQTLWTIAASYKIALSDLLQLNGFTENTYIFPGNKILIQPAGAGADSQARAVSAGAAISGTLTTESGTPIAPDKKKARPTRTAGSAPQIQTPAGSAPTLAPLSTSPSQLSPTPAAAQKRPASRGPDPLLFLVAGLVLGGTGLLVAGNILNRGKS
jgi:LysM repeat protein